MKLLKDHAIKMGMYPKLPLGGKTDHGVKSTGPHTVKIHSEAKVTKVMKGNAETQVFKILVEENGQIYSWLVPCFNDKGEGHYLAGRIQDIEVGDELILEMKKRGPRNYIDVSKPGDEENEVELDEEVNEDIEPTE